MPRQAAPIKLYVGDKVYDGWLGFTVVRSLEAPAGTFNLTVSDKWPGQLKPWPIQPGDPCRLELCGQTLIDGWVDDIDYSLSGDDRSLTVSGRDKTGDLVDCSYVESPNQWQGADLQTIAAALAKPFSVKVNLDGPNDKITNFKVEPGETAFEAIARLCKLKGLLAYPGQGGHLTLAPASSQSLGLTIDERDCLSLAVKYSQAERFSDYLVKGQRPTLEAGRDAAAAKRSSQTVDQAQDPGVKRYRPLMVISEGPGAEARERALWEAGTRAGKGLQVEITLPYYGPVGLFGHLGLFPSIWPLNKRISVNSPALSLDRELLISQTQFEFSGEGGHTTTLTLTRPDAYKPEPLKKGGGDDITVGSKPV